VGLPGNNSLGLIPEQLGFNTSKVGNPDTNGLPKNYNLDILTNEMNLNLDRASENDINKATGARNFYDFNEILPFNLADLMGGNPTRKTENRISWRASILKIDFINVQGLSNLKAAEICGLLGEVDSPSEVRIIGLVETHEKHRAVSFGEDVGVVERMREVTDKRGGGLMFVWRQDEGLEIEKIQNESPDILAVRVRVGSLDFVAVLVYADTRDMDRNRTLYGHLNELTREVSEVPKVIMGDFNAHVGFLGDHPLNANGELMLRFMEDWNLVMLNAHENCEGLYTRIQGLERSVLDYYLVDERMSNKFRYAYVDESKEVFDLSDHCYMSAGFEILKRESKRDRKYVYKEYYKINDPELMGEFIGKVENNLAQEPEIGLGRFEEIVKRQADAVLLRRFRRVECGESGRRLEPPWMNDDLKREIKYRRDLNRRRRRAAGREREQLWDRYRVQKEKVKVLVRNQKMDYEKQLARRIKEDKSSKKMWEMIRKLRGDSGNKKRRIKLYDENGSVLEEEGDEMMTRWTGIYQPGNNEIREMWNEHERQKYLICRTTGMLKYEEELERRMESERNGMLFLGRVDGVERWMEDVEFTEGDVRRRLRKIKSNKQPGPNGVRGEIYKAMEGSQTCVAALAGACNWSLDGGEMDEGWKESKTIMIPKVVKPTAQQHRPIALLNAGCKLFMGMLKEKLIEQKLCNWRVESLQAGFAEGRRLEENIFILGQCVEDTYRSRAQLVVVAIDFSKAFDSVDRVALVRAMKYWKCDPRIIDVVVELYNGDSTKIEREGVHCGEIEVRSGIRQGCTGSPQLFSMVVSMIIEKIVHSGMGYRRAGIYVPVLFYADDGLLLARSLREAVAMVNLLEESSAECGLLVNREKSVCLVFNGDEAEGASIAGIKVATEVRYLGVKVVNQQDCFKEHRREKIELAERMANLTYSVIGRACDRLVIGKTFWKNVVLPSVLASSGVIVWRKRELEKLQRIENGVWRKIFGAPSYTPVAALQGEIGCSTVEGRDSKIKLKFAKFLQESRSGVLRRVWNVVRGGGVGGWVRCVTGYLERLGLGWTELEETSVGDVVRMISRWEEASWRAQVESRSTLIHYRAKAHIGGVSYTNRWGSQLLFRARTNTLRLNWRARFWGGEVTCVMCGVVEETLEHFLIDCRELEHIRERHGIGSMQSALKIGAVDTDDVERFMEEMWTERSLRVV